jgi:SAM-dependent methyltransferase
VSGLELKTKDSLTKQQICAVCAATDWLALPNLGGERSVTTAGLIIPEPLGKAQCRLCGLVQRTAVSLLARTDFYEMRYSFYERPGADRFDRERYAAMADWIRAAVPPAPARVLDAGCGRGWMLQAMAEVFPAAHLSGIEPSEVESENARRLGFEVTTGRVGRAAGPARYDLIYSINVLEHTESPVQFLTGLRERLAAGGHIVITCPDASNPGSEMLFSDQNFSFLGVHLEALAAQADLEVAAWAGPPGHITLRDKQLVVLRQAAAPRRDASALNIRDSEALYQKRCDYLRDWVRCHDRLERECRGARHVYNFGTSTWSFLLAGYCPEYWSQVTCCVIDGGCGEFFGKPVRDAAEVHWAKDDVIILGVDPVTQSRFGLRFVDSPARTIVWNDLITR